MKENNLKTISKLSAIILAVGAIFAAPVLAGQDRGGGDPNKLSKTTIQFLLEGGGLKKAMISYIETISVAQIDDSTDDGKIVKATLSRLLTDDTLQKDIQTTNYFVSENSCMVGISEKFPAATEIGKVGEKICFDINKLSEAYQNLNQEQLMIQLASLAFHEHVHHFQDRNTDIESNEKEAYLVSAYVQITAKLVQVPLLKWSLPRRTNGNGCEEFYTSKVKQIEDRLSEIGTDEQIKRFELMSLSTTTYSGGMIISLYSAHSLIGAFTLGVWTLSAPHFSDPNNENSIPNMITHLDGPALYAAKELNSEALKLLREARIGGGATIESIMADYWKYTNRADLSPKEVANAIDTLNGQNAFCSNPAALDSVVEIFKKTANELKNGN